MPPAAKSGAMKIVLIVVGVMFVFGVLSMAGMYYAAHRYIRMAEDITGIKAGDVIDSVHDGQATTSENTANTASAGRSMSTDDSKIRRTGMITSCREVG